MLKGSMYHIGPKIPTNVSFVNSKSRQERYLLLFHLFFFPSYQLILLILLLLAITQTRPYGPHIRQIHFTMLLPTPILHLFFPFAPILALAFPFAPVPAPPPREPAFDLCHHLALENGSSRRPILAALASTVSVQKATVTEDDPIMHTWAAQVINL